MHRTCLRFSFQPSQSLLTIIVLVSALNLGMSSPTLATVNNQEIIDRIKPVAELNVVEAETKVPSQTNNLNGDALTTALFGRRIYSKTCKSCHGSGIMDAPTVGNTKSWAPHIAKGLPILVEHAIKGFKNMPPKGGNLSLSDDDIKAAVNYMVDHSLPQETKAPASTVTSGSSIFEDVCQACHGTGVMGAPKFGSAKSWAPHIAKGLPVLIEHAINGFKEMPAKGGDDSLSDDDIKAAVRYMVEHSQP